MRKQTIPSTVYGSTVFATPVYEAPGYQSPVFKSRAGWRNDAEPFFCLIPDILEGLREPVQSTLTLVLVTMLSCFSLQSPECPKRVRSLSEAHYNALVV